LNPVNLQLLAAQIAGIFNGNMGPFALVVLVVGVWLVLQRPKDSVNVKFGSFARVMQRQSWVQTQLVGGRLWDSLFFPILV
jgi:hypothetical protein